MGSASIDCFRDGLQACGVPTLTLDGFITYVIEPIKGSRAGQPILTAVEVAEVQRWPAVPPHWIHLPCDIGFPRTNTQASTRPGYLRHSRQINDWGRDPDPAQAWMSHVRGMLSEATT